MLVRAHDGGVDHHALVVVIAEQQPENPLEHAAPGPSVEALVAFTPRQNIPDPIHWSSRSA
jgi:hypothetical protein